ncbi:HdeD family acid-resistance protein [Methanooceanicella nereidis]|nr:DUF308 domain-containing protein [Methanocella sp. CWC-04]
MLKEKLHELWGNLGLNLILRCILAMIFGTLVFLYPDISPKVFFMIFGTFALMDGLILIMHSLSVRAIDMVWPARLIRGLLGIITAFTVFIRPDLLMPLLIYIISAYAIFSGLLQIYTGIRIRESIRWGSFIILSGILVVSIGIIIVIEPVSGFFNTEHLIGLFAIAYGIMLGVNGLNWEILISKELFQKGK